MGIILCKTIAIIFSINMLYKVTFHPLVSCWLCNKSIRYFFRSTSSWVPLFQSQSETQSSWQYSPPSLCFLHEKSSVGVGANPRNPGKSPTRHQTHPRSGQEPRGNDECLLCCKRYTVRINNNARKYLYEIDYYAIIGISIILVTLLIRMLSINLMQLFHHYYPRI